MNLIKKIIFSSFIVVILTMSLFAQDPLLNQFHNYNKSNPSANFFVHFDKNIYTSNETVWFTGYIIRSIDYKRHSIMSVSLINEENNKLILENSFVMRNGLSQGTIILPDSIQPGNYRFSVITDVLVNNKPEVNFVQSIKIKSNLEPPFRANMKILFHKDNVYKVLVSATTVDNRFLNKPSEIKYRYGDSIKTTKTDASGQVVLNIYSKNNLRDPNLYVWLKYNNDSTSVNLQLDQQKSTPSIKFFPEGGNIIHGISNNIAFEIINQQGLPISTKIQLIKDGKVIENISSNRNGIGIFKLTPNNQSEYRVKINSDKFKDTVFYLPKMLKEGIAIYIKDALANDTLIVDVNSSKDAILGLRVHNFRNSYIYTKFNVVKGIKNIKIPLTHVPVGLMALTITDEADNPMVERIFFSKYANKEHLKINTDKAIYKSRQKVKLDLKNLDEDALVSIAVVQDEKLIKNELVDIYTYSYLNNELKNLPRLLGMYKDKKYVEELLLTKGWRRYTWEKLKNIEAKDTVNKISYLTFTGNVTKSGRPLTKSLSIGSFGSQGIKILSTDNQGGFNFNTPELFSASGRRMFMFVNNSSSTTYKFNVLNKLLEMNKTIALLNIEDKPVLESTPNNASLFINMNEKTIRLREVGISAKADPRKKLGANECGDYVCVFNVLNCRNHYGDPRNFQPIEGQKYVSNMNSKQKVIYPGCNPGQDNLLTKVEGIHLHKEFYEYDFSQPQEPAYFSTIYWNYAKVLRKNKEESISFSTSDITGKFRVIVQGITQNNVVFGEYVFDVQK